MRTKLTVLLLASLALLGCKDREDGGDEATLGDLGQIELKYRRSCFFGCPLAQPLLAGTRENVELSGAGNDPGVTVRSTDTEVLEVAVERQCYCARSDSSARLDIDNDASCDEPWTKRCDNRVLVQAGEPGEAMLEVVGEDAEVIDRAEVLVREAASAKLFATLPSELGEREGDAFSCALGERIDLRAELYAEDGLELLAPEGVAWRVADPSIATLTAFLSGSGAQLEVGREVSVAPVAPGTTEIELQVPGLTHTIELTVE